MQRAVVTSVKVIDRKHELLSLLATTVIVVVE